jgi:AbrB family looped-hinge helix DNA binding protein
MRSTITARGQTVVPAPIRERFGLGPSTRLEWIVDGDGSIRVVPVALDPIQAFRGCGAGGGTARLLDGAQRVAGLLEAAQSGASRCLVCFMSRMEVLYRVWKDEGERRARLADAQLQGAVLVHKDPEFRPLAQIPQEWLA